MQKDFEKEFFERIKANKQLMEDLKSLDPKLFEKENDEDGNIFMFNMPAYIAIPQKYLEDEYLDNTNLGLYVRLFYWWQQGRDYRELAEKFYPNERIFKMAVQQLFDDGYTM